MNRQPHASIVMSVYNGARYLRQSIESMLRQEGVEFEFIIVNDGSTDESPAILEEYAKRDNRIRLIHQENQGLTKALIHGCTEARCKYIARQDGDDVSMPGRLKKLVNLLESDKKIVMVSSWTRYIGPEDELVHELTRPEDPKLATKQLIHERTGPPAHGSVMFRTDAYKALGGYRKEFYYGQDSDLGLRFGQLGLVAYVPEYLYESRYSPDAISVSKRDLQKQFGEIGLACHKARMQGESEEQFLRMATQLRENLLSGNINRISNNKLISSGHYFIGSGLYKQGDSRSIKYFWSAIKSNPFYWRAWLKIILSIVRLNKKV